MKIPSICILCLCLLSLTACHDDTKTAPSILTDMSNQPGDRTVLIYMAAQNSLNQNARSDSAEISQAATSIPEQGRLLVFIDDGARPRLYRFAHQQKAPVLVKQWEADFCSTSPDRLHDVLSMVKERFPSREYGLVMWSHASGWIPATNTDYEASGGAMRKTMRPFSFGIDTGSRPMGRNNGAEMNIADMAQAIDRAGWHCRYILFDACLMQNLEVAYALRHVTDYVVASPMSIAAAGAYYAHLVPNGLFATSPSVIARTYWEDVSSSDPSLKAQYADFGVVISCIDTQKLQPIADILREALPHSSIADAASPDLSRVLHYQAYTYTYMYRPHNYDALQTFRTILPAEYAARAEEALRQAVVCCYTTSAFYIGPGRGNYQVMPTSSADYCGVSLFVPQSIYTRYAPDCPQGDLNQAFKQTEWYRACGFESTGW